jgi:PRTRC genetic system protein F
MQPSHPSRRQRKRPSAPVAIRTLAPVSALTLPELPRGLTTGFEIRSGLPQVAAFAEGLLDAGVPFEFSGYSGKQNSLIYATEAALAGFCARARGDGLCDLELSVADDLDDLGPNWEYYEQQRKHKQRSPEKPLSALVVAISMEAMHFETIGPALRALDAARPRLGQTVLDILDDGLQRCVRAVSPQTGLEWAKDQYWRGEDDESEYVKEELYEARSYAEQRLKENKKQKRKPEKMPTDAELIEQIEIFKRKDYDDCIPRCWTSEIKPLKHLPSTVAYRAVKGSGARLMDIFWMESQWPLIRAACLAIRTARRQDTSHDLYCCEHGTYHAVPYVLRWNEDDMLPRIIDDTINQYYESGEYQLEVNSAFLFHDGPSLASALRRLNNFLRLTRACEDLIKLVSRAPTEIKTKYPTRIRV